jgi:hypothetical protein
MNKIFKSFWDWYNKHLALATGIAAGLFVLQLVHLTWLGLHVIALKLTGTSLWTPSPFWENIIILVDYTEIPALITTSLVYINELRKGFKFKPAWYLFSLAIQLLHMFWITDTFVLQRFQGAGAGVLLPEWLAWIAILIDYLEVPIVIETFKKFFAALNQKDLKKASEAFKED